MEPCCIQTSQLKTTISGSLLHVCQGYSCMNISVSFQLAEQKIVRKNNFGQTNHFSLCLFVKMQHLSFDVLKSYATGYL